jgi:hypothetical protein
MAHIITAWRADGRGQSEIKHIRSDGAGYSHEGRGLWIAEQKDNPECVLITRSRTDHQSPREDILWQRPGYVDPGYRPMTQNELNAMADARRGNE